LLIERQEADDPGAGRCDADTPVFRYETGPIVVQSRNGSGQNAGRHPCRLPETSEVIDIGLLEAAHIDVRHQVSAPARMAALIDGGNAAHNAPGVRW
jgi:hypothetical protein